MKWLKDLLGDAKAVLTAPLTSILCVAGVVFIAAAFVDYDKANGLSLHQQVNWPRAFFGIPLIVAGVLLFYVTNKSTGTRLKLDYKRGVEIKRGELIITIQEGEIQRTVSQSANAAIVLPANTAFVDDCAVDKRTAMGAFFVERFSGEISALPQIFKQALDDIGAKSKEDGGYPPGTTIILPDKFAKPIEVIITATSTRTSDSGIISSPQMICSCIEGILKITANRRIDTLYMPILGSGHGGVERGSALLFLVLALLHFSRVFHHIKHVYVLAHPKDIPSLNSSKELRGIVAL